MGFITDQEWAQYAAELNDFHNDAFQQSIIWHRSLLRISKDGEDDNPSTLQPITLKCLIQYNDFRSWPITKDTITGGLDAESMLVFLNLSYLGSLGYLNEFGQFEYQPDLDKFEVNGLIYVDKGNSQTAQAKDQPLLHFLVLKREELETSESAY
jgi:hypothetical protein